MAFRLPAMLGNIVCAQSSGSTALSHMLDRHPDIACGAEMFFFCHPFLYSDYSRFRRFAWLVRMIGLSGQPASFNRAIFRHLPDFGLTKSQVWRWAREAKDFCELTSRMQEHLRTLTGQPVWVEKTPWNIFALDGFLRTFPDAKVIHLVRDPRDVILSLRKRDRDTTLLPGTQNWLTSVAMVQSHRHDPRVLEVRYEDLCLDSEVALGKICGHLGVKFKEGFFEAEAHASRGLNRWKGHDSWTSRPEAGFSTASVGRFKNVDVNWGLLGDVRLTAAFAKHIGTRQWSIAELARTYGYDVPEAARAGEFISLDLRRKLDPLRRWLDGWLGVAPEMTQLEQRRS